MYYTVLPDNWYKSMIGTFVPSDIIFKIFDTEDEPFEDMEERILNTHFCSTYFIEYNGLIFTFIYQHLCYDYYFVGLATDEKLNNDDGNIKTNINIRHLKDLLSKIGVSSPTITLLNFIVYDEQDLYYGNHTIEFNDDGTCKTRHIEDVDIDDEDSVKTDPEPFEDSGSFVTSLCEMSRIQLIYLKRNSFRKRFISQEK